MCSTWRQRCQHRHEEAQKSAMGRPHLVVYFGAEQVEVQVAVVDPERLRYMGQSAADQDER